MEGGGPGPGQRHLGGPQPQLFQRFENLDTGMAAESHGLGLSVVKALVDRYQGKVWVEDRIKGDQGKGSVFVIMLPKAR